MRLRIPGRHDPLLLAGLTFALLAVFQPSIQFGLGIAQEIQDGYGVALIPASLILTMMFVFHVHANRREVKAEAAAAASEARLLRARAEELEQLMLFSQALARSTSLDAIRETVWRHLSILSGGTEPWVLLRGESGWERLTDISGTRWPHGEIERVAERAIAQSPTTLASPDGVERDGHVCFPMLLASQPVGVVGVPGCGHAVDVRRKIGAAAALLSVAMRNARLSAGVRDNGLRDGLTGCYNKEHSIELLANELSRSRRTRMPVSILLVDVDRFKQINDRFGHACGDCVLAAVGQRLRHILRRSDIRCRYGGDEFMVVLPDTGDSGATRVAESLRVEVEQIAITVAGERVPITISVGVSSSISGELTAEALIDRADRALDQAKAAGRNCVRSLCAAARPVQPHPHPPIALVAH